MGIRVGATATMVAAARAMATCANPLINDRLLSRRSGRWGGRPDPVAKGGIDGLNIDDPNARMRHLAGGFVTPCRLH